MLGLCLPRVAAAEAPPREQALMTLTDILRVTEAHNENLRAADLEVEVREAETRGVGRHMLPTVRVEANAILWNDDFVFERFENELGPMLGMMAPAGAAVPNLNMNVRDQFVMTFQAMVIEPLGSLYQIYQGSKAKGEMVKAARLDAAAERHKLQSQVVEAYYNHISAAEMLKVTEAALKQVAAFERMTQDYLEAGLMERQDLLKVQVQRRELEQNQLQAQKGVKLTKAMLNMLMNRPLDTKFTLRCLAEDNCTESDEPQAITEPLSALQDEAVDNRPELRSARAQQAAASRGVKAKKGALLPELNAMLVYQHNEGTGEMMPENAVFGGLSLKWNIFEWGATKAEWDAAEYQLQKAKASISAAEAGIRLQIHQKILELEEAQAKAKVAKATLDLSQENLRLEQARYEVQNTTATDLLAAQTSEVKAAIDLTVARMKVRAAQRGLQIALGRDLIQAEK